MYEKFFEKLKKYSGNPTNFVEKKIRYDDFMALKKSFLSDSYRLYINKLLFAEDLMYHRYTNLFASILQSDHETEI